MDELTEDDVEREFWRLVSSPFEQVEVEYGADVHTSKYGRHDQESRLWKRVEGPHT